MDRDSPTLVRDDRALRAALDRGFENARREAGDHLVCGRGCSRCCFGPFPITRLDAWRLRRGLARLEREDPRAAGEVRKAAHAARETLRDDFPGDAENGRLEADERRLDRFFERHASLPCPVLDRDSGACRLYAHRPVSCRTYGPPLAFEGAPSPPCALCFGDAAPAEVERCRWTPDPHGRETVLLRALDVEPGAGWERLIAHALLDGATGEGS